MHTTNKSSMNSMHTTMRSMHATKHRMHAIVQRMHATTQRTPQSPRYQYRDANNPEL